MNMRKFIIGLIVGIFVAAGTWYFLRTPNVGMPTTSGTPATTSTYGPATPPHVTGPTAPPPSLSEVTKPVVSASGIRGTVSIGPTCPVVPAYDPEGKCADRPFAANLAIMDDKGNLVKTVWSDKNGIFEVMVPAGKYSIGPSPASSFLPRAAFQDVVVVSNVFTTITIQFDSGIR